MKKLSLALLAISLSASAQQINPNQVRGIAGVLNPPGNQTLNQPAGTTYTISSLNTALNPTTFPGSDIGAKINNAVAALPGGCGEIDVPSGTFSFSTTIILPRCVQLRGKSTWSTVLSWTLSAGTAIVVGDTTTPNAYVTGTISQLTILGPGSTSAIGIYLGGDPNPLGVAQAPIYVNGSHCTAPSTPSGCPATIPFPSSAYADFETIEAVRIFTMGTGVVWGNDAFNNRILDSQIVNNLIGIDSPPALDNSGENISVVSTLIGNNFVMGARLQGQPAEFSFVNRAFDFNGGSSGNEFAAEIASQANFVNVHFEQLDGRFLHLASTAGSRPIVNIYSGTMIHQDQTGTDPDFILVDSPIDPTLTIQGFFFQSNHPVTQMINWSSTSTAAQLNIGSLPFYQGGGGNLSVLTNNACAFRGCTINGGNGNFVYNSNNSSMTNAGDLTVHTIKNSVGFQQTSGGMPDCAASSACTGGTGIFPVTEPDTNYQLVCTISGNSAGNPVISNVSSKSTTFAGVSIFNLSTTTSSSGGNSPRVTVSGVAVTGSTPNLSTTLSTGLKGPRFPAGPTAFGYSDAEIEPTPDINDPGALGLQYFNVVTPCPKSFTRAGWQCGGSSASSNPVPGAIAEYLILDGAGTVVSDVSGSGNDSAFATGTNAPTWTTYGLSLLNSGLNGIPAQYIITPLTNWKSAIIGHCTPVMSQTTGVSFAQFTSNIPTFLGASVGSTGGVSLENVVPPAIADISPLPDITVNSTQSQNTADTGFHGGCHVYAYSLDATSDTIEVDGNPLTSYSFRHGSSASSAITSGTYILGTAGNLSGGIDNYAVRGVVTYAIFYGTELTPAQLSQVSRYVQARLDSRGDLPKYPVPNNSPLPQLVVAGDSLSAGFDGTAPWTTTLTLNYAPTISNWGIGGMTAEDVCYSNANRWMSSVNPASTIVDIWAGTNSASHNATAASIQGYLATCAGAIKKQGGTAAITTMISRTTFDAAKNSLDNVLRSNYKQMGFDYLVDVAAVPQLGADGAFSNTACFQADGIHLTGPGVGTCTSINGVALSGYGIVAAITSEVVNYATSIYNATNPHVITTATYSMTSADVAVTRATTADTDAVTLPDCLGLAGLRFSVTDNGTANKMVINPFGAAQTINGATTVTINASSQLSLTASALPSTTGGCVWSTL
jgi:hypothetical protein